MFSYIPFPKDPSNLFVGSYFFYYLCPMEEILYQEIETAIIRWSNDGTKTAGSLTREIIQIIKKIENGN